MVATKPNGFNAKVAVWTMWRYNPGYGWGAGPVWTHESTENIQHGTSDPYPVKFGVPGLLDGEKYAVRVAFCNDLETNTNRRCTCTSDRSEDILTDDFAGSPPSGDLAQYVEDSFRRPNTDIKGEGRDGIGPVDVWLEIDGAGPVTGYGKIIEKEMAEVESGAFGWYRAKSAEDPHSYTEVLYRRHPDTIGDEYSVDVVARGLNGSPEYRGYAVKLGDNDNDYIENPSLVIFRFNGDSDGYTLNQIYAEELEDIGGTCDQVVPLANDPNTPVWVRIEIDQLSPGSTPKITATAAWGNCGENDSLSSCSHLCELANIVDLNAPANMIDESGAWGFWVHHRDYRVENFRAGSESGE